MDSRYGLQCLSMMLHTTALEPTSYDAIVFNFGMHDIDYSKLFPEVSEGSFVFSLFAVFATLMPVKIELIFWLC